MSYDITIWLSRIPDAPDALFAELGFARTNEDQYAFTSRDWIISADLIRVVEEEDVPTFILSELPVVSAMFQLTLQPVTASKSAVARLRKTARRLADEGDGLVENPQTGELKLSTAAKIALAERPARPETEHGDSETLVDELLFSWWFDHDHFTDTKGLSGFLSLLERYLPEALPRRYGEYEPPKFKYQDSGPEAFVNFALGTWLPVIYPTRPCFGVCYPNSETTGWVGIGGSRRFKAGHIEIGLDSTLLDNPLHARRLVRAWHKNSEIVKPFYGDIRILGGRILGRSTLWHGVESESHPVDGPWWDGIPSAPARARVIGAPYLDVWPDLESVARISNGLAFFGDVDGSGDARCDNHVPVPDGLAQTAEPLGDFPGLTEATHQYPATFPFQRP